MLLAHFLHCPAARGRMNGRGCESLPRWYICFGFKETCEELFSLGAKVVQLRCCLVTLNRPGTPSGDSLKASQLCHSETVPMLDVS